jgi:hypothetical protein
MSPFKLFYEAGKLSVAGKHTLYISGANIEVFATRHYLLLLIFLKIDTARADRRVRQNGSSVLPLVRTELLPPLFANLNACERNDTA